MQNIFTKFGYPQYLIADNLPFLSMKCRDYYKDKEITIQTCTPHHHQSNGLSEKAVNIGRQILRKSLDEKSDFRDLLCEYNNTPIINLNASPAQILQSRSLRTQLPTTHNKLEPKVQDHIYKQLCEQKLKMKNQYDKTSRKVLVEYGKGDKVVVKSTKDKHWYKAIVLGNAHEPRSYWLQKECNNRVVRRNSGQMKPSFTKTDYRDIVLEPELYPTQQEQSNHLDSPKCIFNGETEGDDVLSYVSSMYNPACDKASVSREVVLNPSTSHNSNISRSRVGRCIKPVKRLNL